MKDERHRKSGREDSKGWDTHCPVLPSKFLTSGGFRIHTSGVGPHENPTLSSSNWVVVMFATVGTEPDPEDGDDEEATVDVQLI